MHTAASLRLQECAGCCRSLVRATASGEVEQPARAALLTRCWMFRLLPFMLKAAAATVESGLFDSYMRRVLRQGMSACARVCCVRSGDRCTPAYVDRFPGTEYSGEDVSRCVKWCTSNRGSVKPVSQSTCTPAGQRRSTSMASMVWKFCKAAGVGGVTASSVSARAAACGAAQQSIPSTL